MKRLICFLMIISVLLSFSVSTSASDDGVAKDITDSCEIQLIKGSGKISRLKDGKVSTECSTKESFELNITSDTAIYGVYLIWNHTPPMWKMEGESETVEGGEYGFWHEYKALSGGTEYTLSWSGEGHLADVYILSEGTLPDFVQVWEPPCEKADFLLLPTHADDEHLWFGGTMPYYAGELGYKIQVVYLMKHTYDRHHELVNGLWKVGVTNYPVISEFIDKYCKNLAKALSYYPEEEVLEFLVENIRRFKPEVIIGHDLDGEYGHGAHILNAKVLSEQALTVANDATRFQESFEKYGVWETKKCYLHLYQQNEIFINWKKKELSAFGGINAYDMAQKGYEEHKSQVAYFTMSLDDRKAYGNGLFGLFSTTVGPDVLKNDFLENIPEQCLTTWVEPTPPIPSEPESSVVPSEPPASSESDNSENNTVKYVVIITAVCLAVLLLILCLVKPKDKSIKK